MDIRRERAGAKLRRSLGIGVLCLAFGISSVGCSKLPFLPKTTPTPTRPTASATISAVATTAPTGTPTPLSAGTVSFVSAKPLPYETEAVGRLKNGQYDLYRLAQTSVGATIQVAVSAKQPTDFRIYLIDLDRGNVGTSMSYGTVGRGVVLTVSGPPTTYYVEVVGQNNRPQDYRLLAQLTSPPTPVILPTAAPVGSTTATAISPTPGTGTPSLPPASPKSTSTSAPSPVGSPTIGPTVNAGTPTPAPTGNRQTATVAPTRSMPLASATSSRTLPATPGPAI